MGRAREAAARSGDRGGGNDEQVAYDDASYENDAYRGSTGNTGMEGRFYAKVKPTYQCKGGTSKTVWALTSD